MLDGRKEEDRRIYERSARMIFLLALRDIAPEAKVRFEHSLGRGIYLTITGASVTPDFVRRIEQRMREITAQDLQITHQTIDKEKALSYFSSIGQEDTVRLLRYRPFDTLNVWSCGGYTEFFYGNMANSTGEIQQYALRMYYPGLVLLLPGTNLSEKPAPLADRPCLMRAYQRAYLNSKICGCRNAADLNDIIRQGGMRELIRLDETLQQHEIAGIAGQIAARGARIVFVAGPSSSGKTTFANRLSVELKACGKRPVAVSLDNYYLDRDKVPLDEEGKPDLECLESIDVPLFGEQLIRLLDGEEVELPQYSFKTKKRESKGVKMSIGPEDILVVEGIHGLNPSLSDCIPGGYKFLVYVSALTPLSLDNHNRIRATDARFLRRLVRDKRTRGSGVEDTMSMWDNVRAGEEKYIYPYQEMADAMFNTSLIYELPILKKYAYDLLKAVKPDSVYYTRARRVVKFLNYFVDSYDEAEIPPTSILREFIGGCSFYDE